MKSIPGQVLNAFALFRPARKILPDRSHRPAVPFFSAALLSVLGWSFALPDMLNAQPVNNAPWNREVSVHWSETPLYPTMMRLADMQRIGVFLDRHVDPGMPLTLQRQQTPLGEVFRAIGGEYRLGIVFLDTVVYIGPVERAARLEESLRGWRRRYEAPARDAVAKKMMRRIPLAYEEASTPQAILGRLVEETGFSWTETDRLPHDIWNENKLPPVKAYQLFSLLLAGFDRTFHVSEDGRTLKPVPLDSEPEAAPAVNVETSVSPAPAGRSFRNIPLEQRRFTLAIKNQTLGLLLETLATQIGLALEIDRESLRQKGVSLEQRVSFEVRNVNALGLFRAALRPTKAVCRIENGKLFVK